MTGFAFAFYSLFRQDRETFPDFKNVWHAFASMFSYLLVRLLLPATTSYGLPATCYSLPATACYSLPDAAIASYQWWCATPGAHQILPACYSLPATAGICYSLFVHVLLLSGAHNLR